MAGSTMTVEEEAGLIPLGYSPPNYYPPEGSASTRLFVKKEPSCTPLWTTIRKKCSLEGGLPQIPCMRWMRNYNIRTCLMASADIIAGLTVGVMAVPQSVSFAAMAGLPAAYGLYTAFVPVFAYSIIGSSRHLALGPVALVSLLLNDGLVKAIPGCDINENPNQPVDAHLQQIYNHAAIQVSLMVAVLYLLLAVLRLGFLCSLLSRPIISAFLTAGALIISSSQVKYIVGYNIPHADRMQDIVYNLIVRADRFRWMEFAMGLTWIALLVAIKSAPRFHKRVAWMGPLGPITVATLSVTAVWAGQLEERFGIKVVGPIQAGMPPITVDWWLPMGDNWPRLVLTAGLIGAVSLLEAISIAKALAERNGDTVDADQELLGLGVCNLAGAVFCAYPSTGSFARAAGLVNAALIGFVLLCLTPVFQHMPLNALAAIVITGVIGLLDFQRALFLLQVSRMDCLVWLATFLGCLFISIDAGLGLGIALGLLFLFVRTAFPRIHVLRRLPGSTFFRDAGMYRLQESAEDGRTVVVSSQGPLCFANAQRIKERLLEFAAGSQDGVACVVLDLASTTFIDATGIEVLTDLLLKAPAKLHVVLADPNTAALDILDRAGLLPKLGPERMFVRVHDAVAHCAALAVRSDDLGHPPVQNGQNGHSHAQYIVGSVPGWREGSSDMNQPLLVHESIDNA
ncbi:sulfate permease [Coccomyxa subellipsoidea C-169]|uniref:Sulfate permease n=1 Tax=Coccomyxa subellipsoidea (strain C-169) TaxID=574566 RepID=I0Z8X5_COCSC|nr:sulfate permease [Coccomyxa subellipsoidea C-169]EIE27094.1 sulfate permease [Coccomyxa subellipsoidea C-169]|eukprot:XP_005651638.1 sulfate permease [Coccomyxa subellipsoidea C-169]